MLISLTWDVWFSFSNSNLLMFPIPGLLLLKLLYILAPWALCLFGAVSQSIWDAVSWAWSPKNVCRIKHNSQLLGCVFFFQFSVDGDKPCALPPSHPRMTEAHGPLMDAWSRCLPWGKKYLSNCSSFKDSYWEEFHCSTWAPSMTCDKLPLWPGCPYL